MRKLIVAIDGPAGAGKSTVAKRLAKALGYRYIDTGAMYRAFAWKVMEKEIDVKDEKKLERILKRTKIELEENNGDPRVLLNGSDVTARIRTPELSQMASKVSTLKVVRWLRSSGLWAWRGEWSRKEEIWGPSFFPRRMSRSISMRR